MGSLLHQHTTVLLFLLWVHKVMMLLPKLSVTKKVVLCYLFQQQKIMVFLVILSALIQLPPQQKPSLPVLAPSLLLCLLLDFHSLLFWLLFGSETDKNFSIYLCHFYIFEIWKLLKK